MKKLLIIEDEPILLKMYIDKFKKGDYEIISAEDGEEGIEKAIKNKPDFIILDLRLPKMDGISVLKILKGNETIKDIPVALLTVVQEEVALKDDPQLLAKAVAYWRKDQVTPTDVFQNVDRYLKEHA